MLEKGKAPAKARPKAKEPKARRARVRLQIAWRSFRMENMFATVSTGRADAAPMSRQDPPATGVFTSAAMPDATRITLCSTAQRIEVQVDVQVFG